MALVDCYFLVHTGLWWHEYSMPHHKQLLDNMTYEEKSWENNDTD